MSSASSPSVTVAIPTWNRAAYLESAIESVLAQTLQDFELVVLDNASTDGTDAMMQAYVADPRITYIRRETNIGHLANENEGLHSGTARYVTVVHDDEEMYPDNLARKVAFLDAHPEASMVHAGFRIADDVGHELTPHRRGRPGLVDRVDSSATFLRRTIRASGEIQQVSSVVMRRTAVVGEGFRKEDAPADDVALWLRLGLKGSVGYIAEPLTVIRAVAGWSSGNDYMEIDNGRFYPTMLAVSGGKRVRAKFVRTAPLPPKQRAALALETRVWAQRQLISILRRRTPGLRPWSQARELLAEALHIEPSLAVSPLLPLIARSYDRVDIPPERALARSAPALSDR